MENKHYYCECIEKYSLNIEELFYTIKQFEFVSLYLGYNWKHWGDLYMKAWTWKKQNILTRENWYNTIDYGDIYIEDWKGDIVYKWNDWWVEKLQELLDIYYTDWD